MKEKVKARMLRRLWRLLQKLPAERRRSALQRLSHTQRLHLERWALGHAVETCREACPASSKAVASNIVRYVRARGKCYYAAQVQLAEGLRLLSKTERCLKVAQRHEELLRETRELCKLDLDEAIRSALVHHQRLGLRCVVHLRLPGAVLTCSPFRLKDLEQGLARWRRLTRARRQLRATDQAERHRAWQSLREAYLESSKHLAKAEKRLHMCEAHVHRAQARPEVPKVERSIQSLLSSWNWQ